MSPSSSPGEPGSSLAVLLRAPPPHSPAGTSAPPLQLLCRRIGDFATLMCYQTGRLGGGGGGGGGQTVPVISESIVARPSDFEHGNLQLTILVRTAYRYMCVCISVVCPLDCILCTLHTAVLVLFTLCS